MTAIDGTGADTVGVLPDLDDPSVTIVSIEEQAADDPSEQRATADAVMAGWTQAPWPGSLRSVSCFVSTDPVTGVGLLRGTHAGGPSSLGVATYAQWTGPPADGSLRTFEPYGRHRPAGPRPSTPAGCVVLVAIDFETPDPGRLRAWIDGVVHALDTEPDPPAGLLAAHFHASLDGTRVVNLAEWTSAQAHRDALTLGAGSLGQPDRPEWRNVREFPGVVANTLGRYALHQHLTPPVEPRH